MKYYLNNISLFILRIKSYDKFYDNKMTYGDPYYELIQVFNLNNDYFNLLCDKRNKDIIEWIKTKTIHFDKETILEGDVGKNITIFGTHIFLNEEDEQFLFYQKLKNPEIFED